MLKEATDLWTPPTKALQSIGKYISIGIAALLQFGSFMNAIFGSLPLGAKDLLVATAAGKSILPVISVEKMLRNRLEAGPA